MERDSDTICALATAQGLGAISIIRISGRHAEKIIRKLAPFLPSSLESHRIYYGYLRALRDDQPLDEVLISYFQHGRSFTGECTFEISCHGSDSIANEILHNLVESGARPAERGEFTYRAFMNGRIDLVQAESVLALIESRSRRASQLALRQLQGEFSTRLKILLERVTWVLAQLEANIDFASEDIVIAGNDEIHRRLTDVLEDTDQILSGYHRGRIIRSGYQVALAGLPNAGKSSLLNALAGEDRAIVTPVPGTTRDFVEAELSENGVRITLVDTAGLRETDDAVEKIGVARTLDKLCDVDLVFYVVSAETGMRPDEARFFDRVPWNKTCLLINKIDMYTKVNVLDSEVKHALAVMPVSAVTGQGLPEVKEWIRERLRTELSEDSTLLSNARHFRSLGILRESVANSLSLVLKEESPDLIALELQTGLRALYEILGLTYDDQVMDRVFAEFCLGK
ncbi:MAG: tRNA uridine-5-carboxymethylaminomethyl(34) synthesis GTPase MnmE [Bdellovibrionales bacterium]